MPRKNPFPPEPDTQPDARRAKGLPLRKRQQSGPAPKSKRNEAPTLPPPPESRKRPSSRPPAERLSDVRTVRKRIRAATVDVVTADLTKDPRRERDADDD